MCFIISWTTVLEQYNTSAQKQCTSQNSFKKSVKETLLKLLNEPDYIGIHISIDRNVLAKESSTYKKFLRGDWH